MFLNGRQITKHGHDLKKIWAQLQEIDLDEELPSQVVIPQTTAMDEAKWREAPMCDFINLVHYYGAPDGRYGGLGTRQNGPLLHILDQLYSALRSFARSRNQFGKDLYENYGRPVQSGVGFDLAPSWVIDDDLPLERLTLKRYSVGENSALRLIFSTANAAFFLPPENAGKQFGGVAYEGSPLYNHLVRMRVLCFRGHPPPPQNSGIIDQLEEWVKESIKVPNELLKILKQEE